jgi:putative Mg2+ transporter-C (MgtC) family protein
MNTFIWQTIWMAEAFVLSTAIGIERQARHKAAGMRTQALVGVGSALFVIISKYGFQDALANSGMRVDPSRVAASIVSGIGFIGAGVVFTQRNHVHGLTTAASVWITAAIGSACGAGMWAPALACTALYFVAVLIFPLFIRHINPRLSMDDMLHLRYTDGHGTLRSILSVCASYGVSVEGFSTHKPKKDRALNPDEEAIVSADLEIRGRDSNALIRDLSELEGVIAVTRANNAD